MIATVVEVSGAHPSGHLGGYQAVAALPIIAARHALLIPRAQSVVQRREADCRVLKGGPTWPRTRDQPVMSRWLFQLSYGPMTICLNLLKIGPSVKQRRHVYRVVLMHFRRNSAGACCGWDDAISATLWPRFGVHAPGLHQNHGRLLPTYGRYPPQCQSVSAARVPRVV